MESTSTGRSTGEAQAAHELLAYCLSGDPPPDDLVRRAMVEGDGRAFFTVVVERLADLFEPRLCTVYAELLSRIISLIHPAWTALELLQRYERVRKPRACTLRPKDVLVLSRVTLGADIAVTSVLLNAVKQRFPQARIFLVGASKNWELFAADPRIEFISFSYPRGGSLLERLESIPRFATGDAIVVDPDSRITQLGLLPVCEESRYFFFESRAYGGSSEERLPVLAAQWALETFGIPDCQPFIAPVPVPMYADVAVSFGVGGNSEKALSPGFERELLSALVRRRLSAIVDKGHTDEEADRVERAVAGVPGIRTWRGAYAPFASMISQAKLYIGYDSAGQHAAAACGTPLVSLFAGYASDRMFSRWRPEGPAGSRVLKIEDSDPHIALSETLSAVDAIV